jgi:quercetin dioxygenase-like cupin family protein/heme-degrading monooxygenase HmoA
MGDCMAVAIDIRLPGVGSEQYAQLIQHLGPLLTTAPGFLAHSAAAANGDFHIHELWRSEQDWATFVEQHVTPAARADGIAPDARVEQLERLITPAQTSAPRMLDTQPTAVRPLANTEGARFAVGPLTILVKEDGSHTRQTFAVAEFSGKGFRIPVHIHTEHDETIYVLEGTLGVRLGTETFSAPAGTSFTIPLDVAHSVWNESDAPVRFLNTIVPARYLDYFHELSLLTHDGKLAAPSAMKQVMGRYGLQPVL